MNRRWEGIVKLLIGSLVLLLGMFGAFVFILAFYQMLPK